MLNITMVYPFNAWRIRAKADAQRQFQRVSDLPRAIEFWADCPLGRRETPLIAQMLLGVPGGLSEQGFQMFDQRDRISRRTNRLQRPHGFQRRRQLFG
jgi:hypothetical protein